MTRYVEIVNPDLERTCLHCGGNAGTNAHASDCPLSTDVWRIGPREIDEEMCCMGCGHAFDLGDFYTGAEILCLGCAALESTLPAP